MRDQRAPETAIRHRQVESDGVTIHAVEAGPVDRPAILFLHGWPQCWAAFARVMSVLGRERRVIAIDLPGVGGSPKPPPSGDKRTLARIVHGATRALGVREFTLVGHDVGGMIAYAYLRMYPHDLRRVAMLNVAIPGIDPWAEVIRNPLIWHFAFHAIPALPERLVQGHQAEYFDFFFDAIAARPSAISPETRRTHAAAYARPEALRCGFDWYRGFRQDAEDNRRDLGGASRVPVLYVRGAAEKGLELDRYVAGLRASGLSAVEGRTVADSGHFAPEEQPELVANLLLDFVNHGA
jgi:pimeloyl-ACP methyl ester carboxylesterase